MILFNVKDTNETTKHAETFHTSQLDTCFSNEMPANEPGGAILIIKGDSVIFSKGYGVTDLDLNNKIDANTLFNIGSISKKFVSNAILMRQDEGKLSVEDTLSKYFPDF